MLTHGSLFAGYGGLDRAIEDVFGARTAWVSEWEAAPSRVLAHHYPDAPNLGDVTAVDWAAVEPVDIISGGSPCQDLSHAGRRAGMTEGTRSNLWVAMREAIAVLKPTYVVWENVRGAMSADAASELEHCPGCMGDPRDRGPVLRALGRVLGDLADLGYDAQWHGLRAADIGACHGRWRVFVLAYLADADRAGLQGQPHQAGATPAQRHGHPEPGAGRPDLTLLPTPTSSDTNGAGAHGTGGVDLRTAVALLPTPSAIVANDGEGTETWLARRERVKLTAQNGNGMGMPLTIAVQLLSDTPSQPAETHEWMMGYLDHGESPDAVPGQDLRELRQDVQPQALQGRATGGRGALPEPSELLPVVRELQEGSDQGCAPLASPEAPRGDVRGVRDSGRLARAPHRPEPGEQQAQEPADALLVVSPQAPLAGGPGEADGEQSPGCGCAAWGHYAPAIHRHELAFGRIAPPPTEVGPSGKPRLSARAVEWMMMLPAGWVTDRDVTRNEALKMLGNGVVPAQAAAALRLMLNRIEAAA